MTTSRCSAWGPPPPPGKRRRAPAEAGSGGGTAGGAAGLPVGTAVVTKIRSPHTTGVECPRPGTGAFHATPFESLQDTGASPRAIPLSSGPRQRGHVSGAPASAKAPAKNATANVGFIAHLPIS